jgi:hypothetical protein
MDGIQAPEKHAWEKKENPQSYDIMPLYGEHPKPRQHILGIVGGNEVPYKNREFQVNVESDLRGITRANTFCPKRQHSPAEINQASVTRNTPKEKVTVQTGLPPLYQSQMWAYPATMAPEQLEIEMCARPEKY